MVWLVLGIVVFLGIHSVRIFTPQLRAGFIAKHGENRWKGLYTLLSFVGLGLIIWGFAQSRYSVPVYFDPEPWQRNAALFLMIPAFILLAASGPPAGHIKATVKHPMVTGVMIWAFAHLLVNGDLASVLLFGSFLAWSILDRVSVGRRAAAGEIENPSFVSIRGDLVSIGAGLVLYVLFVLKLHEWLIGIAPIT